MVIPARPTVIVVADSLLSAPELEIPGNRAGSSWTGRISFLCADDAIGDEACIVSVERGDSDGLHAGRP